jgi:hypothetical protein
MGDVLLQVAAFPNLLQAWLGLENRLPAAVRLPFAWRMEDRLRALVDVLPAVVRRFPVE